MKTHDNFDEMEARFLKGTEPVIKDKNGNITGFIIDQSSIEMTGEPKLEIFPQHSSVTRCKYIPKEKLLEVEFTNSIYHYKDVPMEMWDILLHSQHPGKFIASDIKKFQYEKIK